MTTRVGRPRPARARGRSPWATTTCGDALLPSSVVDAVVDRAVEADAGVPQDGGAVVGRPTAATSSSSQATNSGSSPAAASTLVAVQRARRSRSVAASTPASRALARERLDRHDGRHGGIHAWHRRAGPQRYAVRSCRSTWRSIGAGSWGTTVAALGRGEHADRAVGRRRETGAQINDAHVNADYLPGFELPERAACDESLEEAVSHADVVVMAVPSHGFRDVAAEAAPFLRPWVPVVSLAKGLERELAQADERGRPRRDAGPPGGGAHRTEPGQGDPRRPAGGERGGDRRRRSPPSCSGSSAGRACGSTPTPTWSAARSAGVVKNVIAIAAGMAEGMGFGDNTRATLITRGLAEMTRLGVAMGGDADHVRRAGRHGRPDRHVLVEAEPQQHGRARARQGKSIDEILAAMNMVAEGVKSSPSVLDLARRYGVEMPITEQVVAVCHDGRSAPRGARRLDAAQPSKSELD